MAVAGVAGEEEGQCGCGAGEGMPWLTAQRAAAELVRLT